MISMIGTNDVPLIISPPDQTLGSVVEQGYMEPGTTIASGTLVASDLDNDAQLLWSNTNSAQGAFGSLALDQSTGDWIYTLDNSLAATQQLIASEISTDSFTLRVSDQHGAYWNKRL